MFSFLKKVSCGSRLSIVFPKEVKDRYGVLESDYVSFIVTTMKRPMVEVFSAISQAGPSEEDTLFEITPEDWRCGSSEQLLKDCGLYDYRIAVYGDYSEGEPLDEKFYVECELVAEKVFGFEDVLILHVANNAPAGFSKTLSFDAGEIVDLTGCESSEEYNAVYPAEFPFNVDEDVSSSSGFRTVSTLKRLGLLKPYLYINNELDGKKFLFAGYSTIESNSALENAIAHGDESFYDSSNVCFNLWRKDQTCSEAGWRYPHANGFVNALSSSSGADALKLLPVWGEASDVKFRIRTTSSGQSVTMPRPWVGIYYFNVFWGDGSVEAVEGDPEIRTISHTYSSAGEYTISYRIGCWHESEGHDGYSGYCGLWKGIGYGSWSNPLVLGYEDSAGGKVEFDSASSFFRGACNSIESIMSDAISIGFGGLDICSHSSLRDLALPSCETIPTGVFANCKALENVSLPSVTELPSGMLFNGCSSLKSVNFDSVLSVGGNGSSGVFLYSMNPKKVSEYLSFVSFGKALEIGSNALELCSSVERMSFPSVSSVGGGAFRGCSALRGIELPSAVSIGSSAFSGCVSLEGIELPSVIDLGVNAFYGCSKIAFAVVPSISEIPSNAFYGCVSLSSVSFQDGIESVGDLAFMNCSALGEISLPSASSVGESAFYNCVGMSSVSIPMLREINHSVFDLCSSIRRFSFEHVESVSNLAFGNCKSLESISLPSAKSLGYRCFVSCVKLSNVDLPSVTTVDDRCFRQCTGLETVSMSSANSIHYRAFESASKLSTIVLGYVSSESEIGNLTIASDTTVGTGVANVNVTVQNTSDEILSWSAGYANTRFVVNCLGDGKTVSYNQSANSWEAV